MSRLRLDVASLHRAPEPPGEAMALPWREDRVGNDVSAIPGTRPTTPDTREPRSTTTADENGITGFGHVPTSTPSPGLNGYS